MSPIIQSSLTLRRVLAYTIVFSVVTILLVYIAYQARFIIAGPRLDIYTTGGTSTERVVSVEGQVNNIVSIELNGRSIYTDEHGYFKEAVVLENGYTITTIRAKDRYGRITTATRSFVYKPDLTDNT